MTAPCLDKSSPRCVLPTSGVVHTCPHCDRVWSKEGGVWRHRPKPRKRP